MITILKDGELNYDFNVWFLKKKEKKMRNKVRLDLIIYLFIFCL